MWIDKGRLADYFGANVQTFFYFTKCVMEFFCIIFGSLERTLYLCKKQCMGFEKKGGYMMKKILTCLLATFGLATACCQLNYRNTDPEGFAKLIAEPDVVVLDVRTEGEYAEGHIKGAVLIDYHKDDFMERAKETLPVSKTIAIYCRSGRRSAYAAEKLADAGYKAVNLYGGIIAWKEAGMPVTTGK